MGLAGNFKKDIGMLLNKDMRLSVGQKAFLAVSLALIVYLIVFIILLVFTDVYGCNTAGLVMARVALGAIVGMTALDMARSWVIDARDEAAADAKAAEAAAKKPTVGY